MKLLDKFKIELSKSAKKRILSACICIAVLIISVIIVFVSIFIPSTAIKAPYSLSEAAKTATGNFVEDGRAPTGMKKVTENDELVLFYNEKESQMAVLHKASGEYWHANPENPEEDSIAAGSMAGKLRSAISIKYFTADDMSGALNSYQACVENGSLTYEFIQNGIRLIYQLGDNKVKRAMLPAVVEKDKFEQKVLSKLSGDEEKIVKQWYKLEKLSEIKSIATVKKYEEIYTAIDVNKEYYFLDLYTPEYELADLYNAVYKTAQYTAEDVLADNKAVGSTVEHESFVSFKIPVEYTLTGDSFRVNIPASEINVPAGLYLSEIELLPFFGAAGLEDDGYIITPDGSGAIVDFNSSRMGGYGYNIPVYGNDAAIRQTEANFNTARANIPVFGMVYQDKKAMLAIIEDGETHATVNVEVAGVNYERNLVGATFELHPMDIETIADTKYDVSSNLYQEDAYKGNITVSYRFTGADNADYASLAVLCRQVLKKQGMLPKAKDNAQLFLRLTAKVEKDTSFIGIPYSTTQSVTTLKEAAEIVAKLKENNVDSINLGYGSWFGGGVSHNAINGKVSLSGGLGGKRSVEKLLAELEGCGELSFAASVLRVYRGLPQFNYFTNAVRLLNNEVANGYFYNPSTYQPEERDRKYYYLSTRYVDSVLNDYAKSVNKLNVSALWLDDVGSILGSDFSKNKNIDRQVSKELIIDALSNVAESNTITASNPDMYVWKYIDNAVDLPTKSSGNSLVRESIPFLQIVLSGSINYSSNAFNRSGNDTQCLLKAVETGADIYYEWIHSADFEISTLDGIETEKLYSMCYENWFDMACEQYKQIKNKLSSVLGKEIIAHEKLEENVYKTSYDSASVIVNYNYDDVTINGTTVGARDFAVIKGEG